MHTVTVLALNGVLAFDLSTPVEVFGRVRLPDGRAAYEVRVCAPADEVDAGVFTIRAPWALDTLEEADTVVVPGLANPAEPVAEEVLGALWRAAEVASEVGFGSPTSFRDLFKRLVGTSPRDYRRAFRGSPAH